MSWSAHFFHPRRSAREAEEIRRYADEMTAYAESVEAQLAEVKAENEKLKKEYDDVSLAKRNVDEMAEQLLSQLAETRKERDKYASELSAATEQTKQIDEIVELVNRFGELKNNYEQRISRLKEKLADARLAIRRLSAAKGIAIADDDLVPIDFNSHNLSSWTNINQSKSAFNGPKNTEPIRESITTPKEVSQPSLFDTDEGKDAQKPKSSINSETSTRSDTSSEECWLRPLPDDLL